MFIKEAMGVFWQTLKDTWEELYSLAIVNLVWLFSWALPISLGSATRIIIVIILTGLISLGLFPITTAGVYYVAHRVAQGRTFHFSDFIEGIKLYWWRSLLWLLANMVVTGLLVLNIWFYPNTFKGSWVVLVSGFWLAVLFFWLTIQLYFWPMLIQQEKPRIFMAWRNSAFLVLAGPFYAFFMVCFTLVLGGLSLVLTLPFIFVGMAILAVLGNNAVIRLLVRFKIIQDPRPKPIHG